MPHIFSFVTNALLAGTALALIPGAISLAARALRQAAAEGTPSPSTTPAKKPAATQQPSGRPVMTAAQAADFTQADPLAPKLNSRTAAAPQATTAAKANAKTKVAKGQGKPARTLAELLRAEDSRRA